MFDLRSLEHSTIYERSEKKYKCNSTLQSLLLTTDNISLASSPVNGNPGGYTIGDVTHSPIAQISRYVSILDIHWSDT